MAPVTLVQKFEQIATELCRRRGSGAEAMVISDEEWTSIMFAIGMACGSPTPAPPPSSERVRRATELLITDLLDEAVPLGELQRIVSSVRQAVDELDRGLEEADAHVSDVTKSAARELAAQLAQPWVWPERKRAERQLIPFARDFVVETRDALRAALQRLQVGATDDASAEADALAPLILELDHELGSHESTNLPDEEPPGWAAPD